MITHGVFSTIQSAVDLLKITLDEIEHQPVKIPQPEPKEVWVDRTGYTPKPKKIKYSPICNRGMAIYKERWR